MVVVAFSLSSPIWATAANGSTLIGNNGVINPALVILPSPPGVSTCVVEPAPAPTTSVTFGLPTQTVEEDLICASAMAGGFNSVSSMNDASVRLPPLFASGPCACVGSAGAPTPPVAAEAGGAVAITTTKKAAAAGAMRPTGKCLRAGVSTREMERTQTTTTEELRQSNARLRPAVSHERSRVSDNTRLPVVCDLVSAPPPCRKSCLLFITDTVFTSLQRETGGSLGAPRTSTTASRLFDDRRFDGVIFTST